jgi:glyoxylase-like metal-dependent hydrolase (beta-lactamase superfamily II)
LIEYLASLSRFIALDPRVMLPGHGRAFTGIEVLAARLRSHSRQRADEIETLLHGGPATPYEIARRLQWQPEGARLVLGLAHTQGHLDLLENAGRVLAQADGVAVRYRRRG